MNGTADLAPLPDLPRSKTGGNRSSSRLIVFGTALFGLMALVAFLPFSPLAGNSDPNPTPTPVGTLPSILDDTTPSGERTLQGAEGAPAGPPSDEEQVVCIDPGHGGWDTGWVRSDDQERSDEENPPYAPPYVTEAELNLGMAFMLRDVLEDNDITVVMTRMSGGPVNLFEEDVNGDNETRRTVDSEDEARRDQAGDRDELQQRINICNEANADILVSLHLNGFNDRSQRGYEILYTPAPARPFGDQSETLARSIYRELDTAMRNSDYGGGLGRDVKPDTELESVQHDLGSEEHLVLLGPEINTASYRIQPSQMPGVIIEGVFLSNDEDAQFIVQPENQQLMVEAYAQGILDYFEQHPG